MLASAAEESGGKLAADLREGLRRRRMIASGRTAASLRVEVSLKRYGVVLRLVGSRIFDILQNGRKPNKSGKPGREQIKGLTEWVKLKGIPIRAVWPMAVKQAREGTPKPTGNRANLLADTLSRKNIRGRLMPALRSAAIDQVRTLLFDS